MSGLVTILLDDYNALRDFKNGVLKAESEKTSLVIYQEFKYNTLRREYFPADEMNLKLQEECKLLQERIEQLKNQLTDSENSIKELKKQNNVPQKEVESVANPAKLNGKTLEEVSNMSLIEFIKWAHFS